MKTYERAFITDLKVFDRFYIKPTYCENGEPTFAGLLDAIGHNEVLHDLILSFNDLDPVVGNDLLHRSVMSPFWKDLGRPIFTITPELAAALILSDLPSKLDMKAPFPAFMLSIKATPDKPTPLIIDDQEYFGLAFFSRVDVKENNQHSWAVWAFPRTESEQSHYQKIPDPMGRLHEWGKEYPGSVTLHRLLVNFFAYITAKKAEGTYPKAKKAKLGSRKGYPVTSLGQEVKLSKYLICAARGESNNDPAYKINKRFIVRGHFKQQHFGPRKENQTKRIWVLPFWKGPDILEATERRYSVE